MKYIKVFLLFWLFTNNISAGMSLETQSKELLRLIKKARKCSVKKEKGKIQFCTGLEISENDLRDFRSWDKKACLKQIKKNGFNVYIDKRPPRFSEKDYENFMNSTKRAYVYYKQRVVLFKKGLNKTDCLHEVLHLYQRHRNKKNELSPYHRKSREMLFLASLEKKIEEIAKYEEKKNFKKAKELGTKLQVFIKLLGEWKKLPNWLDEKEIYEFFLYYPKELATGIEVKDQALTNLLVLKDFLPWQLKERILFESRELLTQKYNSINASFVAPKDYKTLQSLEIRSDQKFRMGKISRDEFESYVIAARKAYWGNLLETEKSLLGHFLVRGKIRSFDAQIPLGNRNEISFKKKEDLLWTNSQFGDLAVDLGAMDSVIHPSSLVGFKRKDLLFLGEVSYATSDGKVRQVPRVQFKKAIRINAQKVVGFVALIQDAGLGKKRGILGLSYFQNQKWKMNLKKGLIQKDDKVRLTKNGISFNLQKDWQDGFRALEWPCGNGLIVRLDTGSQVKGDLGRYHTPTSILKKAKEGKDISCGRLTLNGPWHEELQNEVLFARGVGINLGLPWLKVFTEFSFDLKKGIISFY